MDGMGGCGYRTERRRTHKADEQLGAAGGRVEQGRQGQARRLLWQVRDRACRDVEHVQRDPGLVQLPEQQQRAVGVPADRRQLARQPVA
eukprot:SAG22_NODE_15065_length_358_cov_0.610039_1_plen_88_part_10